MHAWDFLAAKKEIAMVEAARSIATWGGVILLIGGLFSTISALNATIYSSSRVSFAMGRDFNFPEVFSRIHKRFKTPSGSIAVSSSLIIIMLLLLPIEDIASSADIMFLFLFIFVNVALIHIRRKTPGRLTGYKSPLFPLFPVMGILTQSVLVIVMFAYSPRSFFISLLWIGMGLSIYYGYSRLREKGEAGPEIVVAEKELAHKDFNIVLGVEEEREVLPLMNIALPIAKEKDGEIFVSHIIPLPPQTPLNVGKKFLEERKEFLKTADKLGEKNHVPVSYNIRASHKIHHGLLDSIVENKGNILIVGGGELGVRRKILGSILDPLIQEVPCDVGIMKIEGNNKFKKILVSTAGGPNSKIAFEWASYIVKRNRGTLTLLSVVRDETEREKANHRLQETKKGVRYEKKKVEDKIIVGNDIAGTILEEIKGYDLFLFGATRDRFWRRIQFGTIPKKLIRSSSVTTLIVRRYEGTVLSWLRRFIAG
jgi:nucleotide-binding universal stress UspA family protein